MNEKIFADGMLAKKPNEKAPFFIIANLSIKAEGTLSTSFTKTGMTTAGSISTSRKVKRVSITRNLIRSNLGRTLKPSLATRYLFRAMSDLVERIRAARRVMAQKIGGYEMPIMDEAADEIERLQGGAEVCNTCGCDRFFYRAEAERLRAALEAAPEPEGKSYRNTPGYVGWYNGIRREALGDE